MLFESGDAVWKHQPLLMRTPGRSKIAKFFRRAARGIKRGSHQHTDHHEAKKMAKEKKIPAVIANRHVELQAFIDVRKKNMSKEAELSMLRNAATNKGLRELNEKRNESLLARTEVLMQFCLLMQCMLQAFVLTMFARDAFLLYGLVGGFIATILILIPPTMMTLSVTPRVLSNYALALATARLDKEILHEMVEELTNQGDYVGAGSMLESSLHTVLTEEQLLDPGTVRDKVRDLNKLGEQKWRYRVVGDHENPRDAAIEVLEKAVSYIIEHMTKVLEAHRHLVRLPSGQGDDGSVSARCEIMLKDCSDPHGRELKELWAAELSEACMGLAVARLIFNSDRSEDGEIGALLGIAVTLRQESKDKAGVSATFNSLGMLKEKQHKWDEAEQYYTRSLDTRMLLLDKEHSEKKRKPLAQQVAQSLTSLGNLKSLMYDNVDSIAQKTAKLAILQGGEFNRDQESKKKELLKASIFDSAIDYLTRARQKYEEGFGPGHPKLAWAIEGIASMHKKRGNLREAQQAIDESIKIRKKLQDEADGKQLFTKELAKSEELAKQVEQKRAEIKGRYQNKLLKTKLGSVRNLASTASLLSAERQAQKSPEARRYYNSLTDGDGSRAPANSIVPLGEEGVTPSTTPPALPSKAPLKRLQTAPPVMAIGGPPKLPPRPSAAFIDKKRTQSKFKTDLA